MDVRSDLVVCVGGRGREKERGRDATVISTLCSTVVQSDSRLSFIDSIMELDSFLYSVSP